MAVIDPKKSWAALEERLARETDPILRRNLEIVITHTKAESRGDLDGLMDTLTDDPAYRMGTPGMPGMQPRGRDEVRRFYSDFVASGATQLEHDIDRLVVDRGHVVTDGLMRMAYPGRTLSAFGIEVDDPDAFYLYETRMAIVWPISEDGRIIGEESYTDRDGFDGIAGRKLKDGDILPLDA
ncbi:nuclear transport factor 2 family protein [Actinomadura violacea]|uniref:Nuclear transport factor 2 family protein n=1 Tax=Actinomadura violacea TaxID=2819934 RepID=A0ABS3S851_9ACTN|nr:nuclear transport factor 2 family protein [Actinomadura violacea]MBO2465182.1 nuclear transport factor 2 family protein [Actinomadura violacea]